MKEINVTFVVEIFQYKTWKVHVYFHNKGHSNKVCGKKAKANNKSTRVLQTNQLDDQEHKIDILKRYFKSCHLWKRKNLPEVIIVEANDIYCTENEVFH